MKAIGDILAAATPSQRENDRASDAARQRLWRSAVAHSQREFSRFRMWKVRLATTVYSDVIVKANSLTAGAEARKFANSGVPVMNAEPLAFRFFVRQRLGKQRIAHWIEATFSHVDPLDSESPMAWQLRPTKEQQEAATSK